MIAAPNHWHGPATKVAVPASLDWEPWQGPAPDGDYLDNITPYNRHWRWHWGGGELANNGPHFLDICRWGLGVGHPLRVTATGGRFRYDDDQETPDTLDAVFDFGGRTILWETMSWSSRGRNGQTTGAEFLGETGSLVIDVRGGYEVFDERNKPIPADREAAERAKAAEVPAPHRNRRRSRSSASAACSPAGQPAAGDSCPVPAGLRERTPIGRKPSPTIRSGEMDA